MEVRIGVTQSVKEVALEMASDTDAAEVKQQVEAAMAGENTTLWLTDKKGREVAVPGEKIAYVELDNTAKEPKVGFGA